jgi:hypothetical protein
MYRTTPISDCFMAFFTLGILKRETVGMPMFFYGKAVSTYLYGFMKPENCIIFHYFVF